MKNEFLLNEACFNSRVNIVILRPDDVGVSRFANSSTRSASNEARSQRLQRRIARARSRKEIIRRLKWPRKSKEKLALYGTDDGVAMSLSHDADLAAICARSRTDVTLDHGTVPLLHHHWTEFAALAGRRLIASRACSLREDPFECLPEFSVENAVDYRVEGRVTVTEPRENLFGKKNRLWHTFT